MPQANVAQTGERRQASTLSMDQLIADNAQALSNQLATLRNRLFPPQARKGLRRFSSGEAAKLLGITDGYLRQLSLSGELSEPDKGPGGRRLYTLQQVHDIRAQLSIGKPNYLQHRQGSEHLQILAITNFKGGSGKTTTTVHLAQHLAMRGYRVLAIDLDPQASMSGLL
jgi:chromosome partitioning protein